MRHSVRHECPTFQVLWVSLANKNSWAAHSLYMFFLLSVLTYIIYEVIKTIFIMKRYIDWKDIFVLIKKIVKIFDENAELVSRYQFDQYLVRFRLANMPTI